MAPAHEQGCPGDVSVAAAQHNSCGRLLPGVVADRLEEGP